MPLTEIQNPDLESTLYTQKKRSVAQASTPPFPLLEAAEENSQNDPNPGSPVPWRPPPPPPLHLFYLSAKCDLGKSRPMWEPKKLLIVATPRREVLGPKDGGKRKANPKLRS